ncbi:MAG: nucleotidyl transferase AbiEii/AbiGii toxin family protein [Pyrinomonadaceae bacterium]
MSTLIEELRSLVEVFNRHRIDFALCGGLAVAAHGLVRATQDVDFLIREESLDAAYKAAAEIGYNIRGLDISFKERTVEIRRVSNVVGEDVISLDLLLVTPHVEDVWQGREEIEFMGQRLFVVSREGLIKMKRQAGRPQDLADILRLENETD